MALILSSITFTSAIPNPSALLPPVKRQAPPTLTIVDPNAAAKNQIDPIPLAILCILVASLLATLAYWCCHKHRKGEKKDRLAPPIRKDSSDGEKTPPVLPRRQTQNQPPQRNTKPPAQQPQTRSTMPAEPSPLRTSTTPSSQQLGPSRTSTTPHGHQPEPQSTTHADPAPPKRTGTMPPIQEKP
ncbi:hypothetical protein BCR34DRAFT_616768 [Clohesyomyces aquaticus]|uniref:Uncharacterized protein n=1 Tax=Clohesyomyces aquaticus TaxID=1231657 RepID=A0A1Y1ZA69_9PLEO|nr:hypothetical protein BCR34DRAFT_616768 [Clohesyomyces aquaticus]